MEFVILGTAAAEAWPSPFCRCAVCQAARKLGGRDIRSRSGALLDGVVKIDFGPDTFTQMIARGGDLVDITSLIFTHQHDDHIQASEILYRGPWFVTDTQLPTVEIYGNEVVVDMIAERVKANGQTLERLAATLSPALRPFETVQTSDGTTILPLPADHVDKALLLRLTRKGRTIFYGHDSGSYPEATVEALSGVPLNLALFDCTFGVTPTQNRGHMGVSGVFESIERLRDVGAITPDTTLVATHFSHNGRALYDELREIFEPRGVVVAYDGITFEV